MNLHHLLVFHTVAKTGSITASSRQLHISQPALSRELHDLEMRCGVSLFERMPRGMRLTASGTVLAGYAERLFAIAEAAELEMKELAAARIGHLTLAGSNTIGTYVLPRFLARFRREHPGVRITLFVGNTAQVSQGVADMRYTLGFIEGPLHVDSLLTSRFQDDELLPVVAPSHRLARRDAILPGELDGEPLLMRESGSGTRELIDGILRQFGISAGPVMEFGNTEAIRQAALHDGGVAWLPALSIGAELDSGKLVALRSPQLTIRRPLSVIRRAGASACPAETLFMRMLMP
jgi:DNA-binding transcriptional LysR family regulator